MYEYKQPRRQSSRKVDKYAVSDLAVQLREKKTGTGAVIANENRQSWFDNVFERMKASLVKMKVATPSKKAEKKSSGMINIMLALLQCDYVDLYGFGVSRFSKDKGGRAAVVVSDRLAEAHDWGWNKV